jgi:hypothetical protein
MRESEELAHSKSLCRTLHGALAAACQVIEGNFSKEQIEKYLKDYRATLKKSRAYLADENGEIKQ